MDEREAAMWATERGQSVVEALWPDGGPEWRGRCG